MVEKQKIDMGPDHLLRCERPDFRFPAGRPCLFIPRDCGRAGIPFALRHSSLRELRGPCVDIRLAASVEEAAPVSTSIPSPVRG